MNKTSPREAEVMAASLTPPPTSSAKMKAIATGLLVLMTIGFVITHIWGTDKGVWGYARAFAEASMVGGLADWFAVTAIFRRPLGLPIPHTAVIPRNQKRIADAVGRFIAENFLDPGLVADRTRDKDMAEMIGKWLARPEQARTVASGIVASLPGLLDALDDETVAQFVGRQVSDASRTLKAASAVGSVLDALVAQGRHQAILDAALTQGFKLLEENEGRIRAKVRDRTGWLWRMVKVDREAADSLITAIEDLLREVATEPDHPVRKRITEAAQKFALDLRRDPVLQRRVEGWIMEALAHKSVTDAFAVGWQQAKSTLRDDCVSPNSRLREWITETLVNLGEGLMQEQAVREALNGRLRNLLVDLAHRHGGDIARIVSDIIRGWDTQTVVDKLESNVGRDLQFIRVNGTIIGGLVGLALHAGAQILG